MCPSSGEITIYATLSICHSAFVTNAECRIDTVISPDDVHIVARNMQRKEINVLRKKIVHQVDFIYKMMMMMMMMMMMICNMLTVGNNIKISR